MPLESLSYVGVWILALVFLASGVAKIRNPESAAVAMVSFGVLPRVRPTAGFLLGVLEIGLALLLVLGLARTATLVASAVLLGVFFVLVARALAAGEQFPCACFGSSSASLTFVTALRALGLSAVAGSAAALGPSEVGLANVASDNLAGLIAATAVIAVLTLGEHIRNLIVWNAVPYPVRRSGVE